jgi:transposase
MDAAHFVHQAYLGMAWSQERIFIPSPSGRSRYNVLGALNAVTKDIVTVCNDEYINGESVCALLCKLAARKCDNMPITVVLDNARYQRCDLVIKYAKAVGIELLFLPSYSPNLNLIERLWKFVKKNCLYSKYYDKFKTFKEAIMACLENKTSKRMQELETLLTCEFQSFADIKISTV